MSRRASLKTRLAAVAGSQTEPAPVAGDTAPQAAAKARRGKKMVGGYFSPECARAVKMLAVERGVTVQHIIGEGLDAILRQNGKPPFAER